MPSPPPLASPPASASASSTSSPGINLTLLRHLLLLPISISLSFFTKRITRSSSSVCGCMAYTLPSIPTTAFTTTTATTTRRFCFVPPCSTPYNNNNSSNHTPLLFPLCSSSSGRNRNRNRLGGGGTNWQSPFRTTTTTPTNHHHHHRHTMSTMSTTPTPSPPPPPHQPKLILLIAGPTAIGKSTIASHICSPSIATSLLHRHSLLSSPPSTPSTPQPATAVGHIISADSVQAYHGVQIGANKPSREEREMTPHHLIDVLDGGSLLEYNAADWMEDAVYVIRGLLGGRGEGGGGDSGEERKGKRARFAPSSPSGGKGEDNAKETTFEQTRRAEIDRYLSLTTSTTTSPSKQILPVVVGGTMMYLQWLVHGRPDAVRPTPEASQKASDHIATFRTTEVVPPPPPPPHPPSNDEPKSKSESESNPNNTHHPEQKDPKLQTKRQWHAALTSIITTFNTPSNPTGQTIQNRIESLTEGDWYRLGRTLEVAYTVLSSPTTTTTTTGAGAGVDLYTQSRTSGLLPSSSPSTTTPEYDVRCIFLCPTNRQSHAHLIDSRCEDMIQRGLIRETTRLRMEGGGLVEGGQTARAIGYRQTLGFLGLDGGGGEGEEEGEERERFGRYLDGFTAATRQYAKKQMAWFRKDGEFVFVPVEVGDGDGDENGEDGGGGGGGGGDRVEKVVKEIERLCTIPREEYERELSGEGSEGGGGEEEGSANMTVSTRTRLNNVQQGKDMKFYRPRRHLLTEGSVELEKVLEEVRDCRDWIRRSRGGEGGGKEEEEGGRD